MPRILIIDDNRNLLETLEQALSRLGYSVVTATDGVQAAAIFRAEPFDVVVTDIVMPNRDGLETIVALRREFPDVGIIAMTGSFSRSELYLGLASRLGADCTLEKPFKLEALSTAIASLL